MSTIETRSIPELLENAVRHASELFTDEVALLRAEISEKLSLAGKGAVMIGVGAALVVPALVLILLSIAALLTERGGLAPWLADLVAGAGALLVGALFAWIGASRLSAKRLAPRETMEALRRDRIAVKEMVR
ncbi:MAG TPA: phage holin family protein [Rhodoblastus sp.]|nr:phage holin family protein [Rhodoblastus sp.]